MGNRCLFKLIAHTKKEKLKEAPENELGLLQVRELLHEGEASVPLSNFIQGKKAILIINTASG